MSAPLHVVDCDVQQVDQDVMKLLSERAAITRSDDQAERIAGMKTESSKLWGVRGRAQEVADRWFNFSGERVSVRTVQSYFRMSPIKTQSPSRPCPKSP